MQTPDEAASFGFLSIGYRTAYAIEHLEEDERADLVSDELSNVAQWSVGSQHHYDDDDDEANFQHHQLGSWYRRQPQRLSVQQYSMMQMEAGPLPQQRLCSGADWFHLHGLTNHNQASEESEILRCEYEACSIWPELCSAVEMEVANSEPQEVTQPMKNVRRQYNADIIDSQEDTLESDEALEMVGHQKSADYPSAEEENDEKVLERFPATKDATNYAVKDAKKDVLKEAIKQTSIDAKNYTPTNNATTDAKTDPTKYAQTNDATKDAKKDTTKYETKDATNNITNEVTKSATADATKNETKYQTNDTAKEATKSATKNGENATKSATKYPKNDTAKEATKSATKNATKEGTKSTTPAKAVKNVKTYPPDVSTNDATKNTTKYPVKETTKSAAKNVSSVPQTALSTEPYMPQDDAVRKTADNSSTAGQSTAKSGKTNVTSLQQSRMPAKSSMKDTTGKLSGILPAKSVTTASKTETKNKFAKATVLKVKITETDQSVGAHQQTAVKTAVKSATIKRTSKSRSEVSQTVKSSVHADAAETKPVNEQLKSTARTMEQPAKSVKSIGTKTVKKPPLKEIKNLEGQRDVNSKIAEQLPSQESQKRRSFLKLTPDISDETNSRFETYELPMMETTPRSSMFSAMMKTFKLKEETKEHPTREFGATVNSAQSHQVFIALISPEVSFMFSYYAKTIAKIAMLTGCHVRLKRSILNRQTSGSGSWARFAQIEIEGARPRSVVVCDRLLREKFICYEDRRVLGGLNHRDSVSTTSFSRGPPPDSMLAFIRQRSKGRRVRAHSVSGIFSRRKWCSRSLGDVDDFMENVQNDDKEKEEDYRLISANPGPVDTA